MKKRDEELTRATIKAVIIGVIIAAIPVIMFINSLVFGQNAIETTATVTDFKIHIDSDGDKDYTIYFEYTDEAERFTGNYRSSSRPDGGVVTVFYNPSNPRDVSTSRNTGSFWWFITSAVVIMFVWAGISGVLTPIKRRARKTELLADGRRILAALVDVTIKSTSDNEKKDAVMICEFTDEASRETHKFKSYSFSDTLPQMDDPEEKLLVPVYVDNDNYKKYYVAVEEFFQEFQDPDEGDESASY